LVRVVAFPAHPFANRNFLFQTSFLVRLVMILIAGQFQIDTKLRPEGFNEVFCGTDIDSQEKVALKVEKAQSKFTLVPYEARVYRCLHGGVGIPRLHWHGAGGPYNFLVMDLLGPTIQDVFELINVFGLENLSVLAKEVLDRIEYVHRKGFIYRDVKPENFAFQRGTRIKNDATLYIINFGLCKKYICPRTKQHIGMRQNKSFKFVSPFASHRARQGFEQSRRDDVESIGNMIMYLQYRKLPMIFHQTHITPEVDELASADVWLSKLPVEFVPYLKYAQSLGFEEEPRYDIAWERLRMAIVNADVYRFTIDWTVCQYYTSGDKVDSKQRQQDGDPKHCNTVACLGPNRVRGKRRSPQEKNTL